MADKSFRILLDATDLRLECFKCVWINVSLYELRTISDLKNDVLRKINIERDFNLYVEGGLLLDEETITVLRENDTVQIKYKTPNPTKESPKQCVNFSRKRNVDESNDSNDVNSKRQRLETCNLSSEENKNFVKKKSKKRDKKETELPTNSENFFTLVEKQREPKSFDGKSKVIDEDVNSKKHEPEIVTAFLNGNADTFVGKKSEKVSKKKEKKIPRISGNLSSNSLEERKKQKELFINSENISCISVEERKEKTKSSVTYENSYSTPIEENQSSKKSRKIKNKNKSPIASSFTVTDLDVERSPQNIACSFFVTDLDNECSPQKQKSINKVSKTILFYPEKNLTITSIDGLSSKSESNIHQSESSTFITDINSEEVNNNQSKTKRKRRRKRKKKTNTIGICDSKDNCNLISDVKSSSENVDENINRKHILYLSPAKNYESNCFNNVNEFPNSSTDKFILKDQSLDYPKMSTPAQSKICSIPDLQLSVMANKKSNLSYNENYPTLPDKSTTECVTLLSDREDKELYENLPDVTTLPIVGTHIAYKTLELDESYSPIASDYREGIIEKIDPDTEELEIRLDNQIILPAKNGKFENLEKDEVPEPTVKTFDILKWSDLIEPKLLNSLPK